MGRIHSQCDNERKEDVEENGRDLSARAHRCNALADGRIVYREDQAKHQVRVTGSVILKSRSPIPAHEK